MDSASLSLDNQEKWSNVLKVLLWRSRRRSEEPKSSLTSRVGKERGAHLLMERVTETEDLKPCLSTSAR